MPDSSQRPTNEETTRLRARWIFPVSGPPLERATVEIVEGKIAAIHVRHDPKADDLGNVALIPGLVNAHTHLEFSDLARPLEPSAPFTSWIRTLVAHRRTRQGTAAELVRDGWAESAAAGVASTGEIATDETARPALEAADARGVVFRELLGFLPERIDEQLAIAERHVSAKPSPPSKDGGLRAGLSPHAPYSVHPELFHRSVKLAAATGSPLAMHFAETRAELEFLKSGTGEFRTLLESFGVWRSGVLAAASRPLDYLKPMSDLDCGLVVHGNYLSDEEKSFLRSHPQLSVVYCPRTHAYFGHTPHPWLELLSRGASVALGTDSRASNPDLSLWNELRFLRSRFPEVSPQTLLELGTTRGARALGDPTGGTLSVGSNATLTLVALPDVDRSDPYDLLFDVGSLPLPFGGSRLPDAEVGR